MMLLHPQPQPSPSFTSPVQQQPSSPPPPSSSARKRKATTPPDSSSRLSKRLSLLNLEQSGAKLYVPVESSQRSNVVTTYSPSTGTVSRPRPVQRQSQVDGEEEPMQLDDTKHKVYIYNIDDELSSESEKGDAAGGDGEEKVVFLPDIEKHLRRRRMLPGIPGGELGGLGLGPLDMGDAAGREMVLYSVPRAISVPEEQDSVRKAIIEARQRMRERQKGESEEVSRDETGETQRGGMREEAMDDEGEDEREDADAMELD
ncbi:hypothetical protein GE09DRAFT_180689 [Coniochaeta sp. 2T2.1]|nr:hypothetical protein GE09DRAFT_180689 [Coniochaeta sp. 2T2.1]